MAPQVKLKFYKKKVKRTIDFLPVNASVEKRMYEINKLTRKDFIMLQIILFVKYCLSKNALR